MSFGLRSVRGKKLVHSGNPTSAALACLPPRRGVWLSLVPPPPGCAACPAVLGVRVSTPAPAPAAGAAAPAPAAVSVRTVAIRVPQEVDVLGQHFVVQDDVDGVWIDKRGWRREREKSGRIVKSWTCHRALARSARVRHEGERENGVARFCLIYRTTLGLWQKKQTMTFGLAAR